MKLAFSHTEQADHKCTQAAGEDNINDFALPSCSLLDVPQDFCPLHPAMLQGEEAHVLSSETPWWSSSATGS